jgi:hypothetical protein
VSKEEGWNEGNTERVEMLQEKNIRSVVVEKNNDNKNKGRKRERPLATGSAYKRECTRASPNNYSQTRDLKRTKSKSDEELKDLGRENSCGLRMLQIPKRTKWSSLYCGSRSRTKSGVRSETLTKSSN